MSARVSDKQQLLRQSVPFLVTRLVQPHCVDEGGSVVAESQAGACPTGKLEFAPVTDVHVGIITSSLGGQGAHACLRIPLNLGAGSAGTRALVPGHSGTDRSEATVSLHRSERRADDQLLSVFS